MSIKDQPGSNSLTEDPGNTICGVSSDQLIGLGHLVTVYCSAGDSGAKKMHNNNSVRVFSSSTCYRSASPRLHTVGNAAPEASRGRANYCSETQLGLGPALEGDRECCVCVRDAEPNHSRLTLQVHNDG